MLWFRLAAATAAVAAWGQLPPPISADALRVDVSYLASDYLNGRKTPSAELDRAAEFIASQFQRAGLEAIGKQGYFQVVEMTEVTPRKDGFQLSVGGATVPFERVMVMNASAADAENAPVHKVVSSLNQMSTAAGRVLLMEEDLRSGYRELFKEAARLKPLALIVITPFSSTGWRNAPQLRTGGEGLPDCPILRVSSADLKFDQTENLSATLHLSAPEVRSVTARNVVGVVRGSDLKLRDTYVLLSAHYDHLGRRQTPSGEAVFKGANDDASGTASLIEIAASLAAAKPARSIVFAAFFGEEMGLLGSRHYVQHPLVPLQQTVAAINLEQVGRTDDNDGPRVGRANLTGFDYSNIGEIFAREGKTAGIEFYKQEGKSDNFFRASDNLPFAQAGVPAHTVSVSYMFPDYHNPGDQWQKLDYENMARIGRAVAAAALAIANSAEAPKWNADNPKVEPFRKARQ